MDMLQSRPKYHDEFPELKKRKWETTEKIKGSELARAHEMRNANWIESDTTATAAENMISTVRAWTGGVLLVLKTQEEEAT